MSEETVEKANTTSHVSSYNKLVEEANALGMKGYRPIASRFRDAATGAARVAALESSIKAFKSGLAAEEKQPGPPVQPDEVQTTQEEADMANTTTARKTKNGPKSKAKAKVATKAKTKSKAKASQNARTKVAPKEKVVRPGIVGLFKTREGTNREKLLLALEAGKGKPVSIDSLLKSVYGNKSEENKGAIKMVLLGIDIMIEKEKLHNKYELVRDGRGDEATFALVKK